FFLQWSGNAAVTADTPEVNRHQKPCNQWQSDAVQHVESKQGALPDKSSAEQTESRVAGIRHQTNIAKREQRRSGPFISQEWRCASHVASDGDGPHCQLIPRQQITSEAEQQRQHQ